MFAAVSNLFATEVKKYQFLGQSIGPIGKITASASDVASCGVEIALLLQFSFLPYHFPCCSWRGHVNRAF